MGGQMSNKQDARRLSIYTDDEFFNEFVAWAERLRLTRSQFGYLCLIAGFPAITRSVDPLKSLDAANWQTIIEILIEKGYQFEIPDQQEQT